MIQMRNALRLSLGQDFITVQLRKGRPKQAIRGQIVNWVDDDESLKSRVVHQLDPNVLISSPFKSSMYS